MIDRLSSGWVLRSLSSWGKRASTQVARDLQLNQRVPLRARLMKRRKDFLNLFRSNLHITYSQGAGQWKNMALRS